MTPHVLCSSVCHAAVAVSCGPVGAMPSIPILPANKKPLCQAAPRTGNRILTSFPSFLLYLLLPFQPLHWCHVRLGWCCHLPQLDQHTPESHRQATQGRKEGGGLMKWKQMRSVSCSGWLFQTCHTSEEEVIYMLTELSGSVCRRGKCWFHLCSAQTLDGWVTIS